MIDTEDPCYVFGVNLNGEGGSVDIVENPLGNHWIHIDYAKPSSPDFLRSLGLSESVIHALIQHDPRPRTVLSNEGILAFIRGINLNPGANPEDMVSLRLWIEQDRLITVRQRKLLSIQDTMDELSDGLGAKNIPDLVLELINGIANRISDYVDTVEGQIETIELSIQTRRDPGARADISSTRREIASVRRYLAPQRDALDSLYTLSLTSMPEGYAFLLREQLDRMTRYLEDLDLLRERTLVVQEEWTNISMEEQNGRMYALSIVAAVFLPITFVTGIFGMNVEGLPGTSDPNSFLYVAGSMVISSIVVITYLKFRKWL